MSPISRKFWEKEGMRFRDVGKISLSILRRRGDGYMLVIDGVGDELAFGECWRELPNIDGVRNENCHFETGGEIGAKECI
jgi:hypothetical protein